MAIGYQIGRKGIKKHNLLYIFHSVFFNKIDIVVYYSYCSSIVSINEILAIILTISFLILLK